MRRLFLASVGKGYRERYTSNDQVPCSAELQASALRMSSIVTVTALFVPQTAEDVTDELAHRLAAHEYDYR